jgi:hypothetical protein
VSVVYVGREISDQEVFAKIVDAGFKIESVENQRKKIVELLNLLQSVKVGHNVEMENESFRQIAS